MSTINCGAILPTSNNELLYVILGSAGTSSPAPASFILNPGTVLDSTPHVAGTSYGLTHGYYELPSPVSIVETWSWTNNGIALAVVGGFPAFPFTYPPYDMMGTMAF